MALGFTDGTSLGGVASSTAKGNEGSFVAYKDSYGQNVGVAKSGDGIRGGKNLGVTTDPTKSGVVANLSGINIGNVNSLKLGKYILKY